MIRFVILGLPRSGTTYLQTLLNAHPAIRCRGEMFDPSQIDDDGRKIHDRAALVSRDADPAGFFDTKIRGGDLRLRGVAAIGIKVLFHHNPALFRHVLPDRRELRLIHVRRDNKLAQFASARQVQKTGAWVATEAPAAPVRVPAPAPAWAMAECNRLETQDFLMGQWLSQLPHAQLALEYRELFAPGLDARLCGFLDQPVRTLTSPLKKQGQNRVIDRFENPDALAAYFTDAGRGDWLGSEL